MDTATRLVKFPLAALAIAIFPMSANAYMNGPADLEIQILCLATESCSTQSSSAPSIQGPSEGTASDGTQFFADANPTYPSTGTGVFEPFVRIQRSTGKGSGDQIEVVVPTKNDPNKTELWNSQNGFNSNAPETDVNYDTKNGTWTYAVQWGDIDTSEGYVTLQLDANQNGSASSETNQILITDMQIYIGSDPSFANPEASDIGDELSGYTGAPFDPTDNSLLNQAPEWTLDSAANGDVDIRLQASICDSAGQCGSGHGDLTVFIPLTAFANGGNYNAEDYFVFYSEYLKPNDGFEEWRLLTVNGNGGTPTSSVPEPSAMALLGFGLFGMGAASRRRRKR